MFDENQIVKYSYFGKVKEIPAKELSNGSHTAVNVVCDHCGDVITRPYYIQLRLMKSNECVDTCVKCRGKVVGKKLTFTIDKVRDIFKEEGCTLLSTEYKKAKGKLKYVAQCGCESEITLDKFRAGHGRICVKCHNKLNADNLRLSSEYVEKYFKDNGCETVDLHYVDNNTKIDYIAQCGHKHKMALSNFQAGKGRKCPSCSLRRGADNNRYNPEITDEQRERRRSIDGYKQWRKGVFDKDKYTCQCCGSKKSGTFNAHHIYNYAEYPELRIDILNGATLCNSCHEVFHMIYGYKHNTPEQLEEFIELNKEYHKDAV